MKRIFVLAFAFSLCMHVSAQNLTQTYTVIDVLDEKNTTEETWTIYAEKKNIHGERAFRLIKRSKTSASREELHTRWFKEIRTPGQATYLKEAVILNADYVSDGKAGFGFTEEKMVDTDEVLQNWPFFFRVSENMNLKRIVYDMYISNSDHMNILRDYVPGNNLFPLREVHTHFTDGKLTKHTIYRRH